MRFNNSTQIISVTIINIADDTEEKLHEIKGSKCHFCKEFDYSDYLIRLRLDWKDIRNGEPTLDADIWRKPKSKKNCLRKGPWHHTEKKFDPSIGRYIYTFEFENLRLCLGTKITAAKDIICDVRILKPSQGASA